MASSNHQITSTFERELTGAPYTSEYYDTIRDASRRSAQVVAPMVIEMVQPKSIIDVGCGDGTWLSVFRQFGVDDVAGLDGDYVDRRQLKIPPDRFTATDLSSRFESPRAFDLAMSLEVAEHLPSRSAEGFVDSMTRLAPVVLFSAAIPHQGGTEHVNEQWPAYWAALFENHNYLPVDCLRARIWANEQVEWYYAQNILMFASAERLREDTVLRRAYETTTRPPLALVHPKRLMQPFRCGVRDALHLLAQATLNAVRKRVPALPGERY